MRRISFVLALLVSATAQAQTCGPSPDDARGAYLKADAQFKAVADMAEKSRAAVVTTYRDVEAAIARISKARAVNAEADLDKAMAALGAAKKAYDQAVANERPQLIARLESERASRGARQDLTDAATSLREQGEALVKAVERARRGEVTPSATDALSCEQGECARVSSVEHAALLAIGATADTVSDAPAGSCGFTVLAPGAAGLVRALRTAQKNTATDLQAAEADLNAARQTLAGGIPAWDKAITAALDTHASPAGNSHADELLGMAIEDLNAQSAAFAKLAAPYRAADEKVMAARQAHQKAADALNHHLDYWADVGRAVADNAARAQRNLAPRISPSCPQAVGPWTYPLTPPPNC
jgi:hypothetical protein